MLGNKSLVTLYLFAFFIIISCKTQQTTEIEISRNHSEKIQVYVRKDTIKLDKDFPGDVNINYIKLDFEQKKISFAKQSHLEGEKKDPAEILQLLHKSEINYFVVTKKDEFEIPKHVRKYNRKWNDFATPGRSVTPAIKFVINGNSIQFKGSKKPKKYVFDSTLTKMENDE